MGRDLTQGTGESVRRVPPGVCRHVRITASLSGHNTGLVGRIGDWTWDVADRMCGADPYRAKSAADAPAYLSFCYVRLRALDGLHTRSFGIGDHVAVASGAYSVGPGALYAAHRIGPLDAPPVGDPLLDATSGPSLLGETYNRWVARSCGDSNERLVKAAPPAFSTEALPALPAEHHPRPALRAAWVHGSFVQRSAESRARIVSEGSFSYTPDLSHDINGVDLLYFASYFAIANRALLEAWTELGQTREAFLVRRVLDHRMAYFANADHSTRLEGRRTLLRTEDGFIFDLELYRQTDGRKVAVSTILFKPAVCNL